MIRLTLLTMNLLSWVVSTPVAMAGDSSLTYQGQLQQQGQPFTGAVDLEFHLFDQSIDGMEVASPISRLGRPAANGLFQIELDFGATAFDGGARFLEARVNGAPLNSRQAVMAAPRALSLRGLRIEPSSIPFGDPAQAITTNTIAGSPAN